jgi:hypothetical protein
VGKEQHIFIIPGIYNKISSQVDWKTRLEGLLRGKTHTEQAWQRYYDRSYYKEMKRKNKVAHPEGELAGELMGNKV